MLDELLNQCRSHAGQHYQEEHTSSEGNGSGGRMPAKPWHRGMSARFAYWCSAGPARLEKLEGSLEDDGQMLAFGALVPLTKLIISTSIPMALLAQ